MSRLCVVAFVSLALSSASAFAQDVWATPGAPSPVPSPENTAPSTVVLEAAAPATYDSAVLAGARKVVLRDFDAAIDELREAAGREAARPEAFCRLGDAQLANDNASEARAAYETCLRFATAERNEHEKALALIGIARTFERENKTKEERDAWQRVVESAKDELSQALAAGRSVVLDAALKQDEAYGPVRTRIAERASKATPAAPTP